MFKRLGLWLSRRQRPRRSLPKQTRATECIEWVINVIGRRELAKHIDILKHFAHEVIQNSECCWLRFQTSYCVAYGRHPDQGTTSSSTSCMCRWESWDLGQEVNLKHCRDLCPYRGVVTRWCAKVIKLSCVSP